MFERFTESARQAIVLAHEEARALSHAHIGPEHLLLGLARESQGGASRALAAAGATAAAMRQGVRDSAGEGEHEESTQIPFTPDSKRALELALKQSTALGYSYIATEHLLLGVLAAQTDIVARVLAAVHASPERVREETLRVLEDTKPLRQPDERRRPDLGDVRVSLSPRAREIWTAAAERALQQGRTEVLAGDLLVPVLSDAHLAELLASVGLNPRGALAALEGASWPEPEL